MEENVDVVLWDFSELYTSLLDYVALNNNNQILGYTTWVVDQTTSLCFGKNQIFGKLIWIKVFF